MVFKVKITPTEKDDDLKIIITSKGITAWINHTLQGYYIITNLGSDVKLRSEDESIRNRIRLFEESKNLVAFMTPTRNEFEKEFMTLDDL